MQCSNCGKDIPYMGSICPWCGVDKESDRRRDDHTRLAGCGVGLVVYCIALAVSRDPMTALGWALMTGAIVGGLTYSTSPVPRKRIAPTIQRVEDDAEGDTKTCPFCAETIKAAAVVCRYCGRDLNR